MKFQGVLLVSLVFTLLSANANPPPAKFIKEIMKKGSAVFQNAARSTRSSLYSSVVPAPQYKVAAQYAQQLQEHYAQQLAQYPSLSLGSAGGLAAAAGASLRGHKKPLFNPQPLHGSVFGEISHQSPKTVVLDATDAIQEHPHYAPEYNQAAYRSLKAAYPGHTSPAAASASLTNDNVKLSDAVVSEPKYAVYSSKTPSYTYTPPATHKVLAEAATSQIYSNEEHGDKDDHYASKYHFGYQVRDPKHGSYFGHSEARDGHVTKGQYHVLLPDGRLQNVLYYADPTGFHAQVSYNGVARHADSHTLAAHAV